jgi:hypothetical protein
MYAEKWVCQLQLTEACPNLVLLLWWWWLWLWLLMILLLEVAATTTRAHDEWKHLANEDESEVIHYLISDCGCCDRGYNLP